MKTFFMVGVKRSGTSLMVRLLNKHPDIGMTPESDIIWILYQMVKLGRNFDEIRGFYNLDGKLGLTSTKKNFKHILKDINKPTIELARSIFFEIQNSILNNKSVKIIGDKKPYQQSYSNIVDFTLEMFPDVKFLHITRHPQAFIYSPILSQNKQYTLERGILKYKMAVTHVKNMKKRNLPVHSFKYEDLCSHPQETMNDIFKFLELPSVDIKVDIKNANNKYAGMLVDQDILDIYGYEAF